MRGVISLLLNNMNLSFDSFVCDLYVKNILVKVNKAYALGDLSFITPASFDL